MTVARTDRVPFPQALQWSPPRNGGTTQRLIMPAHPLAAAAMEPAGNRRDGITRTGLRHRRCSRLNGAHR
jgi:hypothetical protein